MTDWEIFVDGLKFQWVIHPQWNHDLFWGLLLGTIGFCIIFSPCTLSADNIIKRIDKMSNNSKENN